MHELRTQAIILRRTNYGEADRIITFLTPDDGKVTAIAKGVRKPKSKLAGGLELFATSDVVVRRGRGEVGTITAARLVHFYGAILRDYERMQLGYLCIKLTSRITETVSEPAFYHLLRDAFSYLEYPAVKEQFIEVWFRLQTMNLLGTGLNLVTTFNNQPLQEDGQYDFDFGHMSFMPYPNGRFGANHIKLLRLLSAKVPTVIRQVSGVEDFLADCLWLVRAAGE